MSDMIELLTFSFERRLDENLQNHSNINFSCLRVTLNSWIHGQKYKTPNSRLIKIQIKRLNPTASVVEESCSLKYVIAQAFENPQPYRHMKKKKQARLRSLMSILL